MYQPSEKGTYMIAIRKRPVAPVAAPHPSIVLLEDLPNIGHLRRLEGARRNVFEHTVRFLSDLKPIGFRATVLVHQIETASVYAHSIATHFCTMLAEDSSLMDCDCKGGDCAALDCLSEHLKKNVLVASVMPRENLESFLQSVNRLKRTHRAREFCSGYFAHVIH